ncbi:MAG: phosphonate ABC transporter ATP-binding protein [Alphaproteobacteria bacterium]
MLEIEGLGRRYGDRWAVSRATITVPQGQCVGVIGRSGAGKSTLLRMINRLVDPTEGTIRFAGTDVTKLKGQALRDWRQSCAMIFQQFNLVGRLDVLTNVLVGRLNHVPSWRSLLRVWSAEDKAVALSALEQFDMAASAAQRAENLSGGQQQRVAIARALVQEPKLLLADEPVASLDPRNSKVVMDAIRRINRHYGITVLVNLHSLDLARGYCDRLVGIAAGRVVFDDVPAALTDAVARELYGLEAGEVLGGEAAPAIEDAPGAVPVTA